MIVQTPLELLDLLKKQRKDLGISAALLASLAGVSPKFISQLENGKESIEIDSLLKVIQALGVSIPILAAPSETGKQIHLQRITLGMDQRTAAGLCNVSPKYLSNLENGYPKKRLNKLFDVLNGLGISIEVCL